MNAQPETETTEGGPAAGGNHSEDAVGAFAERTGTDERYAREWLEHQAISGYLSLDTDHPDASARSYLLPSAHAEVLLDSESLAYLAPLGRLQAAIGVQLPNLLRSYRDGGGVSWAQFGVDAR